MDYELINREQIGERLRDLRDKCNKSLARVSGEVGISASALGMYERGKRMPRDVAKIALANYYHVSLETLFYTHKTQIDGLSVCPGKKIRGGAN